MEFRTEERYGFTATILNFGAAIQEKIPGVNISYDNFSFCDGYRIILSRDHRIVVLDVRRDPRRWSMTRLNPHEDVRDLEHHAFSGPNLPNLAMLQSMLGHTAT
ncbi:MAG TPA: hypothetical protein VG941_03120 [Candidatus Paceibacterota bacterium]|nr:hypothetical protein [Candidatus Paceibacterota bacterium]